MTRVRLWIIGGLGLVAGSLAYRWVAHDRPIDAPRAPAARPSPAPAASAAATPTPPPAGPTLAVTIVDARTGAPRADVALVADGAVDRAAAVSDAAGATTVPAIPGRWRLTATGGGAELALSEGADWELGATPPPRITVRVMPVADLPAPLELPALAPGAGALVGVVTVAGARAADLVVTPIFLGDYGPGHPVTHARVPMPTPLPPRRFVGTGGLIRWDGLTPGSYAALVVAPGHGAAVVRATVTAALAGSISVELAPAASLSGMIVDQRGTPIAHATLRVVTGGVAVATVGATSTGAYLVPELPPGPVAVEARAVGCLGDHAALTLPPGQRAIRSFGLVCDTPDAIVTPLPPTDPAP